jgi:hypothetical protein
VCVREADCDQPYLDAHILMVTRSPPAEHGQHNRRENLCPSPLLHCRVCVGFEIRDLEQKGVIPESSVDFKQTNKLNGCHRLTLLCHKLRYSTSLPRRTSSAVELTEHVCVYDWIGP